jgi:UDP-N-acetylmuramoyl-L-alanyl-D-glutamate--2,6-diaminopimelate ligase
LGAIAERLADAVVVTDDNPRTEDGAAIVTGILAGMRDPSHARVIRNREDAIAAAIEGTRAGDVVLVAGKGHEDYQLVGAERRAFSDREVARRLVEAMA